MTTSPEELELIELTPEGTFTFHCHPGVPCFNDCCAQTTIVLSPYEVLRLKQYLGLSAAEFLRLYTRREADPASGLPLVLLQLRQDERRSCPFSSPAGCQVYPARPAACRYYPVGVGHWWSEAGLEEGAVYFREAHCCGFSGDRTWTLATWRRNQGLEEYDELNRSWKSILLRVAARANRPVSARLREEFYSYLYDLEVFKNFIFTTDFLNLFAVEAEVLAAMQTDEVALLRFAYRYFTFMLRLEDCLPLKERRHPAGTKENQEDKQ